MAYRRTEKVEQRLRARHGALIAAAREIAAAQGLDGVQIVPVAERAGVASGTVYRYFASKTALVAALVDDVSERELEAMQKAASASPGPLSGLAAAIVTFAARAERQRRLVWAVIAEPVDAELAPVQRQFLETLTTAFAEHIERAAAGGRLGDADPAILARMIVGGLLQSLLSPLATFGGVENANGRRSVQAFALYALRAVGIVDARARGLVVQAAWPTADDDSAVSER